MRNYELRFSNQSAQIAPLVDVFYLSENNLKQCSHKVQSKNPKYSPKMINTRIFGMWGLLKMQILELHHRPIALVSINWDPEIWICNKHPDDPYEHKSLRCSS